MTGVCACACIFLYYSARGDINVHTVSMCEHVFLLGTKGKHAHSVNYNNLV